MRYEKITKVAASFEMWVLFIIFLYRNVTFLRTDNLIICSALMFAIIVSCGLVDDMRKTLLTKYHWNDFHINAVPNSPEKLNCYTKYHFYRELNLMTTKSKVVRTRYLKMELTHRFRSEAPVSFWWLYFQKR